MTISNTFKVKIAGQDTFITCNKFNAHDCLMFITSTINMLPSAVDDTSDYLYTKKGANFVIMRMMDSGIRETLDADEKELCKSLIIDYDYFATIFKTAYNEIDEIGKTKLTDKLLKLYTYNNGAITENDANLIFPDAITLFSALLHAVRYNYNSFFIIGEH